MEIRLHVSQSTWNSGAPSYSVRDTHAVPAVGGLQSDRVRAVMGLGAWPPAVFDSSMVTTFTLPMTTANVSRGQTVYFHAIPYRMGHITHSGCFTQAGGSRGNRNVKFTPFLSLFSLPSLPYPWYSVPSPNLINTSTRAGALSSAPSGITWAKIHLIALMFF